MSPHDVAELFTVAESTLCHWRRQGRGPRFVRMGSRIGYIKSSVVEWQAQHIADVEQAS